MLFKVLNLYILFAFIAFNPPLFANPQETPFDSKKFVSEMELLSKKDPSNALKLIEVELLSTSAPLDKARLIFTRAWIYDSYSSVLSGNKEVNLNLAVTWYEEVLSIFPNSKPTLENLAQVFIRLRNYEAALEALIHLQKISSSPKEEANYLVEIANIFNQKAKTRHVFTKNGLEKQTPPDAERNRKKANLVIDQAFSLDPYNMSLISSLLRLERAPFNLMKPVLDVLKVLEKKHDKLYEVKNLYRDFLEAEKSFWSQSNEKEKVKLDQEAYKRWIAISASFENISTKGSISTFNKTYLKTISDEVKSIADTYNSTLPELDTILPIKGHARASILLSIASHYRANNEEKEIEIYKEIVASAPRPESYPENWETLKDDSFKKREVSIPWLKATLALLWKFHQKEMDLEFSQLEDSILDPKNGPVKKFENRPIACEKFNISYGMLISDRNRWDENNGAPFYLSKAVQLAEERLANNGITDTVPYAYVIETHAKGISESNPQQALVLFKKAAKGFASKKAFYRSIKCMDAALNLKDLDPSEIFELKNLKSEYDQLKRTTKAF